MKIKPYWEQKADFESGVKLMKLLSKGLDWKSQMNTVVYFADSTEVLAIFAIADTLKTAH